jgi:hypothetical protein
MPSKESFSPPTSKHNPTKTTQEMKNGKQKHTRKAFEPHPTNDETTHQKESRDSDLLQEGKKKNKRNRSPRKDKKIPTNKP